MQDYLWTKQRAELFVRGLYYIARCDGLHLKEEGAIQAFMERTHTELNLSALDDEPFDYERAARGLDSTWLRKVFVQACRIMVQIDGRVTRRERDALRAMASAMGIGETSALAQVEGHLATPVNLIEWIDNLEVDFVSWDDHHQPGYFWEFPHPNRPIAPKAVFHVYEGQVLVVSHQDQVTDTLAPGSYYATPDNLPGLAEATGWSGGSQQMDLVFVRTSPSPGLRWGLSDGVELTTDTHGEFELRAYGRCAVRVHDAALIKTRMTGLGIPTSHEMEQRVGRIVAGRVAKSLLEANENGIDLTADLEDLDALRDRLAPKLREHFKKTGLNLIRFSIENVTLPLEMGIQPRSLRADKLMKIGQEVLARNVGESHDDSDELDWDESPPSGSSIHSDTDETSADFVPTSTPDKVSNTPPPPMKCHLCASLLPAGALFCSQCGAAQRIPCPKCGIPIARGAAYCSQCGHKSGFEHQIG